MPDLHHRHWPCPSGVQPIGRLVLFHGTRVTRHLNLGATADRSPDSRVRHALPGMSTAEGTDRWLPRWGKRVSNASASTSTVTAFQEARRETSGASRKRWRMRRAS